MRGLLASSQLDHVLAIRGIQGFKLPAKSNLFVLPCFV